MAQMSEFDDEEDVEEEVKAPPAKLPSKQASSGLFGGSVGGLTLKPKALSRPGAAKKEKLRLDLVQPKTTTKMESEIAEDEFDF